MGFMKKTLAVSTLGASVAVEKGAKAAAAGLSGKSASGDTLSQTEVERGVIFRGMSHESGRNAEVTLYADRIERVKQRSRMSVSGAHQEIELTPIRTISSVKAEKDGYYTKVTVHATGNNIDFKFRHEAASEFRELIQQLILDYGKASPVPQSEPAAVAPDVTEQLKKLGELRDAGVLTDEEFASKKTELLARL